MAVDYAGHPADLDELRTVADRHQLLLIEDAAHSIDPCTADAPSADCGFDHVFLFPTKNLTTAEGGAVTSGSDTLAYKARSFHNHGLVRDPSLNNAERRSMASRVHEPGLNYRLPDVLAALGTSQLSRLAEFKTRRKEIHALYGELLEGIKGSNFPLNVRTLTRCGTSIHCAFHRLERRRIFEQLRTDGIGVQVNYIPAYWHPAFADAGYPRGLCTNAETYYAGEISLPCSMV